MALIQYVTRIQFEFGALRLLPDELGAAGIRRALLVTDPGVQAAGILDQATKASGTALGAVYADTRSNPDEADIRACQALYESAGCDGLIALGGGSAIDLAKSVALLSSHGGSFGDYEVRSGGSAAIRPVSPWIAIPTSAGTGAEVGRAAVITLDSGRKVAAVNLNMAQRAVICDPELTLSLPPLMTAATGIDALSHGLEAFVSTMVNPPAAAIARDCVGRIAHNIRRATEVSSDRAARHEMMMGALEGGLALQKSLGAIHAMASPLGELHLHHGQLIGVLMPGVLRFNAEAAADGYAELKSVIGLDAADDLATWAAELVRDLGLPTRLSDMGVTEDVLAPMAEAAAREHLSATNPRPADAKDYLRLLQEAF